jgi:hypothetical protein
MKPVRVISIATLGFLAVTSLIGAVPLIIDPTGNMLSMPLSLLEHSPFRSFLIPGLILLFANGLLSFWVLAVVLRKTAQYPLCVVLQGCVLAGWITVQVVMIRTVVWAHYVYWAVALILIVGGWLLKNDTAGSTK